MKKIQYKDPIVYSDRDDAPPGAQPAAEARRDDAEAPASHDLPTVPVEADLEDRNLRMPFRAGEGFLQISVKPGSERLGEIQIEIQFEGEVGKPAQCGHEHSEHFLAEMARLEDILEEILDADADFECQIAALPCPAVPIELKEERGIVIPVCIDTEVATGNTVAKTKLKVSHS